MPNAGPNQVDQFQIMRDAIKNVLADKAEFALLFGSIVTNRIMSESDIDIGVYFKGQGINFEERLALLGDLESAAKREIDLVEMNTCDIIIAMQILANGEVIINNNPGLFVLFKSQKISEYIDFKRGRKIIEDSMLTRRMYA